MNYKRQCIVLFIIAIGSVALFLLSRSYVGEPFADQIDATDAHIQSVQSQ